ncbi:glycosyltransferase [Streptomyces sp. NPDC056061]|uniref:glycosyltransferase n=1 Tax=Streptomyces sp. NPDC056061 TaxID=3345700 RepID=UPI0035D70D66
MRIGFVTDGDYPYASGESGLWCDRLVRGLDRHEFDLFVLSRSADQEERGSVPLPAHVGRVRTAPLWTADGHVPGTRAPGRPRVRRATGRRPRAYGRRERQRFMAHFTALATSICAAGTPDDGAAAGRTRGSVTGVNGVNGVNDAAGTNGVTGMDEREYTGGAGGAGAGHTVVGTADARFAEGLYGLADLARECGGLSAALRSETAVRVLEAACRAPGSTGAARTAGVADLLHLAHGIEELLRPLSFDWYDERSLGAVDLCHAASGGAVAVPGLLAKRFFGVPLLVTEHSAHVRTHYLDTAGTPLRAPVRAVLAAFHRRLAAEVYRQAALITPGDADARRWQERCGAGREKLRTVHPGLDAGRFVVLGESGDSGPDDTVVWVGRIEPAKGLITLLHAFAQVHRAEPAVRLRIIGTAEPGPEGAGHLARCRALAARLFPEAADAPHDGGGSPVSFEGIGGTGAADVVEAYAAAGVVVPPGTGEHFPAGLVEAMFCGRATVSADVGAVVDVIGGTGLVVPPRNPEALADACLALLRDPERRARLGAAARARALELFTVEQNVAAFRGIYLELISRVPVRREAGTVDADGGPRPFATPPEAHVPGLWTAFGDTSPGPAGRTPSWAVGAGPVRAGAGGAGGGDV